MFGQIQHLTTRYNDGELTPQEYKYRIIMLLSEAEDDDLTQFSRAVMLVQA